MQTRTINSSAEVSPLFSTSTENHYDISNLFTTSLSNFPQYIKLEEVNIVKLLIRSPTVTVESGLNSE